MQSFTANLTGNAELKIKDGRRYLVAPVSMIVPGVLHGSKGALHYPKDMVARNAGRWEDIPLTLGHPSDPTTNTPLSASDPGVTDRLGLGFVKNDRFATGKHRAEAWFDEEKVRAKAPHVYAALNANKTIEVSTGLFTQEVAQNGKWNGRDYDRVVTGYKPDHLAILTDQRGACSVSDGCGVHNAAATTNNGGAMAIKTTQNDDDPSDSDDTTENDKCPCGGSCASCKATKNAITEPLADQPRCPIKQTFQPKGFKGKGRGEVHVAAKKGFNDIANPAVETEDLIDKETDVTTKPGVTVQNSNPEGINQYTHGGGGGKDESVNHPTVTSARDQSAAARIHTEGRSAKEAHDASSKANFTSATADAGGRGGHMNALQAHREAYAKHTLAATTAGRRGDHEAGLAHTFAASAHAKAFAFHKERGKEFAQEVRNQVTDNQFSEQSITDRSSTSGQTKGESDMDRKAMISHLTTNCDCYKGKAGAVLNHMTDEQLKDLITNAQAVAEIRKLDPGFAALTANAMPAALKAAMDKKKGGPDEDEEDSEVEAPTKNAAAQRPLTEEEWLKTAPPSIRKLVQNNLARDRAAKERLIVVLVENVQDGAVKNALVYNYLKFDVNVLQAQVDALPTRNAGGEFEFSDGGPNYSGSAISGHDRVPATNRSQGVGEVMLEEAVN